MTEGTEQPQEIKEVPQETQEVAEARQAVDRATFEPEAAVEQAADFKQAEAVETAVKESLEAAVAVQPAADGERATEDRVVETSAPTESAGESPPPPEAPDPVEPMFPASATGGSGFSGVDVTKTPVEDNSVDELSISQKTEFVTVADSTSQEDFSAELEGGQPREVQEFTPEEEGNQTYALRGDGQTGTDTIPDRIEDVEAAREAPPETAIAPTQQESQEASSPTEVDSEVVAEVQRGDDPQQVAASSLDAEQPGEETSAAGDKAVGGTTPAGNGLPVDEETEESGSTPPATESGEDTGTNQGAAVESEHSSGKASFGEPAPDPAQSYSGVEMEQGAVAQDSDGYEGIISGDQPEEPVPAGEEFDTGGSEELKESLTPFRQDLGALRRIVADVSGDEGGSLTIEAAPDSVLGESSETDQLANQDIQNMLQHQQQLMGMLSQISDAMQNTANAIDRKADGGSDPAEGGQEEGEDTQAQQEADAAQLEMMDLQDSLNHQSQLLGLMSNLKTMITDSSMSLIRNLEGGESNSGANHTDVDPATDQNNSETIIETGFEDSTQGIYQYQNTLSAILKSMQEAESSVKRNLVGEGQENSLPAGESESSISAADRIFRQYSQEIAEIVQQAETALEEAENSTFDEGKNNEESENDQGTDDHSLEVQSDMQHMGRISHTISNIMKTQHDTLKAILNNMR